MTVLISKTKANEGIIEMTYKGFKEVGDGTDDIYIEGYANTTKVDRAGDLIPLSTWQKPSQLDNYKKNPIVLAFHDHAKPIGETVEMEVRDEGLFVRARISETIPEVFKQIKAGILKTFSIGFRLLDWEYKSEMDIFLLTEIEMYELSVVSVPCNQDSLFDLSKSSDRAGLRDALQKIKASSSGAPVAKAEEDAVIKLARMLGIKRD